MASVWFGHFDSTPEDERVLLAEDWAKYIRAFISDGVRNGGTTLQVSSGGGMDIKIHSGIANIQAYILYIDEDRDGAFYTLKLPGSHPGYSRIDRVVLRLDRTIQNRAIIPMILIGAAGSNPQPPALTRNANIYELSLARVRVNAGVTAISNNDIIDERFDENVCGLMHSILGLNSSTWQNAFDAFLSRIDSAFVSSQGDRAAAFSQQIALSNQQMGNQADRFLTLMNGLQLDLAIAAGFDFWNLARMPGNSYVTEYRSDGRIVTTIRRVDGNKLVATGTTSYPADGSVVYEETVYQSDGSTIQRKTRETTEYPADGTIKKVVINLL